MNPVFRLAAPEDAPALLDLYRPHIESTHVTFETEVPSVPDFAKRIEQYLKIAPWIVAETEGAITGYAYASKHRDRTGYQWSVESSVYVRNEFQGRGLGRSLYRTLFRCLELQGFVNVYAGIALPNSPSIALHESLGFRSIGVYRSVGFKLGKWIDVGWWSLALREPPPEPAAPRFLGSSPDLLPEVRRILQNPEP